MDASYLATIEDIGCVYVATDLRGIVVEANRAAAATLGCSSIVGKALVGFVARRDTQSFRAILGDLAARRCDLVSTALRLRQRGGPVFPARLSARIIHGPSGKPESVRWLVRLVAPGAIPAA
jgi:PAS domain S-box-containing protein